ncbi:MAG: hypothetical protein M1608_01145, partial [Candidatus Omnitrophica bacterium]|nr:hypothetical protein [Candidatus Omnitrophota bacterium]
MEDNRSTEQTLFSHSYSFKPSWLLALALGGLSGSLGAEALPLDPVCFPLAAEVATLRTNRAKVGFAEFPGHVSAPPKIYLSNQLQHYRIYDYSQCSGPQLSYYNHLLEFHWDTVTHDPNKSFALPGLGANGCSHR